MSGDENAVGRIRSGHDAIGTPVPADASAPLASPQAAAEIVDRGAHRQPLASERSTLAVFNSFKTMASGRVKMLAIVLGAMVAGAVIAWVAASRIESPADAAARAAAPPPSAILVPVERRVLGSNVVTRGTGRFGLPVPVSIAPSTLKLAPGLIATLPIRGTHVSEGGALLTASGRPVFVLRGELPAYRDMVPGLRGVDVRQLKQALRRLGLDPGADDDTYSETTGAAVAAWYRSRGWEPFGPTREQLTALHTLEHDEGEARKAALAAGTAAAAAAPDIEGARAKAQYADAAAESDLAAAIADDAFISLDPRQPDTARAAAKAKVDLARANAHKTHLEGQASVRTAVDAQKLAELELRLTSQRARQLATELALAQQKLGVQVPVDELVFLRSMPVRVEELKAAIGAAATGPVLSVTDNRLSIDSALPLDAAALVKPGMKVAIDEQALGVNATGVVQEVANSPGTRGADGFHIYFEVRVDPTPTKLDGVSVRLTIPVKSTNGAVTAVPISALSLGADGSSRVQVQENGQLKFVTVKPGLSADGYVEIASADGKVKPGELVVVGYNDPKKDQNAKP